MEDKKHIGEDEISSEERIESEDEKVRESSTSSAQELAAGRKVTGFVIPAVEAVVIRKNVREDASVDITILIAPYVKNGNQVKASICVRNALKFYKKPWVKYKFKLPWFEKLAREAIKNKADPEWIRQTLEDINVTHKEKKRTMLSTARDRDPEKKESRKEKEDFSDISNVSEDEGETRTLRIKIRWHKPVAKQVTRMWSSESKRVVATTLRRTERRKKEGNPRRASGKTPRKNGGQHRRHVALLPRIRGNPRKATILRTMKRYGDQMRRSRALFIVRLARKTSVGILMYDEKAAIKGKSQKQSLFVRYCIICIPIIQIYNLSQKVKTGLKIDRKVYVQILRKMLSLDMIEWRELSQVKVTNGLQCVRKDVNKLRLIFDGRPVNCVFQEPRKAQLPSFHLLEEWHLEATDVALFSKINLDNYYHRLGVPHWMKDFLSFPPVSGKEFQLITGCAREHKEIGVVGTTLPMGLAHAVFIAQEIHLNILTRLQATQQVNVRTHRGDKSWIMVGSRGPSEAEEARIVNNIIHDFLRIYAEIQLEINQQKLQWGLQQMVNLGYVLDGKLSCIQPSDTRLTELLLQRQDMHCHCHGLVGKHWKYC